MLGLGWGDTGILLLITSAIGLSFALMGFIIALIAAAGWSVWLLWTHEGHAKTPIHLTPFMTIGTLATWMWGDAIQIWFLTHFIFM